TWFIISIVVYAFDSPIRSATRSFEFWTWPHVRQEIREAIGPSVAHMNTSCTVVFVGIGFWIQTALFHLLPYMPDLGVAQSMPASSEFAKYLANTSASYGVPGPDVVYSSVANIPAVTFERPHDAIALSFIGWVKGHKSAITLSRNIEWLVSARHDTIICHMIY